MDTYYNCEKHAKYLRSKLILPEERKFLLTCLNDSEEAKDLYTEINCQGYGRIRKFCKYSLHLRNVVNKNSIKPLLRGHNYVEVLRSQTFQLAGCNWHCWYCFVDDNRRSANLLTSKYFSAKEIIDMYREEKIPPAVIDLSGGQPDLVPEWGLWMMKELERQGLQNNVFLWADDNLSNNYFWKFLNREQIEYMVNFPKYSRVGCFKGYNEESFYFNTCANPVLFNKQFKIFYDFLLEGFDMYAYATFTNAPHKGLNKAISNFIDRLQKVHCNLPLRTIPLKIASFTVTRRQLSQKHQKAIKFQYDVYDAWSNEISKRFSQQEISLAYENVSISL